MLCYSHLVTHILQAFMAGFKAQVWPAPLSSPTSAANFIEQKLLGFAQAHAALNQLGTSGAFHF
jgi:hypothetical protein